MTANRYFVRREAQSQPLFIAFVRKLREGELVKRQKEAFVGARFNA